MKRKQKTQVIFLIEKPEGDLPCDVFAFFPKEKYTHSDNGTFMSYAHIGQHSPCHIDYALECEECPPEKHQPLKAELEGIGYELEIISKSAINKRLNSTNS